MKCDIWLFKDGLALRLVALDIWPDVAGTMCETLNDKRTQQQITDGYEYVVLERKRGKPNAQLDQQTPLERQRET